MASSKHDVKELPCIVCQRLVLAAATTSHSRGITCGETCRKKARTKAQAARRKRLRAIEEEYDQDWSVTCNDNMQPGVTLPSTQPLAHGLAQETDAAILKAESSLQQSQRAKRGINKQKMDIDLLEAIGAARDLMRATFNDRESLLHVFGGTCERTARIMSVLEYVPQDATLLGLATDLRIHECQQACQSVEGILEDLGYGSALNRALARSRLALSRACDVVPSVPPELTTALSEIGLDDQVQPVQWWCQWKRLQHIDEVLEHFDEMAHSLGLSDDEKQQLACCLRVEVSPPQVSSRTCDRCCVRGAILEQDRWCRQLVADNARLKRKNQAVQAIVSEWMVKRARKCDTALPEECLEELSRVFSLRIRNGVVVQTGSLSAE
jgi:hypothetical protein